MARRADGKENRHKLLREKLEAQPYLTDGELAEIFHVSVPTIRLDRMSLGIRSLQGRLKQIAATGSEQLPAAEHQAGVLVDIEKGVRGISIMETNKDMCFTGTDIVQGGHIYMMAENLALAIIGKPAAITQVGNIKYKTPVVRGSRLVARGEVREKRKDSFILWVKVYDRESEAYRGKFIFYTKVP